MTLGFRIPSSTGVGGGSIVTPAPAAADSPCDDPGGLEVLEVDGFFGGFRMVRVGGGGGGREEATVEV